MTRSTSNNNPFLAKVEGPDSSQNASALRVPRSFASSELASVVPVKDEGSGSKKHRIRLRRRSVPERNKHKADEARHRDDHERRRLHKHRNEKESELTSKSGRKKKHVPLDKIDRLDVTGLYGSGMVHHDGPFDACNPHRNKNRYKSPVLAFPADSVNNSMNLNGPLPSGRENAAFGKQGPEAYNDYGAAKPVPSVRTNSFDPGMKTEPVHGNESLGLGTSTFLEGAPASKSAIQRVNSPQESRPRATSERSGLVRKKSLAQKIRALKGSGPANDNVIGSPGAPRSAGASTTNGLSQEYNPFFSENRDKDEKPTAAITVPEEEDPDNGAGGLLKRVKSLKVSSRRKD